MVAKENLQFSFISFFCFFPSLFWCRYGDTLSSRLHSQHCIPPSCSALATPPHLAAFPIFMLFGLWSQWSWALCLAKNKNKNKSNTFSFSFIFFPSMKVIVKPLFSNDILFKNHYYFAFSWELFYQCWFLLSTPTAFSISVSPSVIPECFIFFNSLLLTLFISIRFQCYKQYSCCHHSYFWTNYTFCLLNRIYIEICFMPVVPTHKCHDF